MITTKSKRIAEIEFDGKKYNLSSIIPLENFKRVVHLEKLPPRQNGHFTKETQRLLSKSMTNQVKVRHEIAQKLGYKNFIELGYARMLRSDYNAEMVANFRQQILEHVVPVATKVIRASEEVV